MPFNGAGTFNRLYSWQTDAANGIKIRADRMDAETNGIATGLSTCVTRDGQSAATANLPMGGFRHTNVGAAQNPTDYATAGQVVNSGLTYATGVGGTSNAVTLTTTVAPTALAAGQLVMFKATSDVVAGGVTVNRSVLGAKAVQQFGAALPAGAWLNGDIVILEYDGAQYQLIWPLRTAGLLGSNNIWTGIQTISSTAPELRWRETDQALPAGLWRWFGTGSNIILQRNTAVAGDFSTNTQPLIISAGDVVTFLQPPAGSGASLTNLNASALSSGTIPNGVFPATLPAVSGVNLTALNASNLGSGTVPDARFPATLPAISGANLTALNASNIASGTIADARLSSNVPLKNGSNIFVTAQQLAFANANLSFKDTSQVLPAGLWRFLCGGNFFRIQRNTAPAGDFSTGTLPLSFDSSDVATFLQPPIMSGASITSLNAGNLSTGTVPDARFPATLPAISGVNLTALNASNLGSGTVPDARFPATLPAISGANLTNLNASNLASGTVPAARLPKPAAATLGGVKSLAAVAHKFLTSIGTDGLPVAAQPVVADLSDAGTSATVNTGTSGATLGLLNANKTDSGNNTYSGTSAFTGQATFSKQVNGPEAALVDGASISWDLSTAQAAHVTLGGNRTLANPTNMVAGGSYALKVTQDGTGSRTLAYGSAYKWAGGVAPVLSTAANAVDVLTFYSDGTNMYGAILKAFA
jgi:hypothetical protein